MQGINNYNIVDGAEVTIRNCIIDESKHGIDAQGQPTELLITGCTFGSFFNQESINRHNSNNIPAYQHPAVGVGGCNFYEDVTTYPTNAIFNITDLAAGNVTIENSIFYKEKQVISLPYPANTILGHVYNIKITENTFVCAKDAPGAFLSDNNEGGYYRIADNYGESCTWDYDKINNSTNGDEILISHPNFHQYSPGSDIAATCTTCPSPPEPLIGFSELIPTVSGIPFGGPKIPYINEGDNLSFTVSNVTSENVVYTIRVHANNSGPVGSDNVSGNNSFNNAQLVTDASTTPVIVNYQTSPLIPNYFDSNKPGLYGIDVIATNASISPNANYKTSTLIHHPFIVNPIDNYKLIFNIKDSYYADLYGIPLSINPGEIQKQVELNGQVIWEEDILDGGNDWEQVAIDLEPRLGLLNAGSDVKNTITFSIAITSPGNVTVSELRGLKVWVDDIYLKKFDNPDNLIPMGDIEDMPFGGLSSIGTNTEPWYFANSISFVNCHNLASIANLAASSASIGYLDRKSGSKSILLDLEGLYGSGNCTDYDDYTPNANDVVISAAVDFDYRGLINCDDYDDLATVFTNLDNSTFITNSPHLSENFVLNENLIVPNGQSVEIKGCELAVNPNSTNRWTITVKNGGSLTITYDGNRQSRIFACGNQMWDGIVVENGGLVTIKPVFDHPTEISDATTAIHCIGGASTTPPLDIRYANFKDNYIGLDLNDANYYHGNPISNSGLIGITFNEDNDKLFKEPHQGELPLSCIQLNNVEEIQIGSAGSANPQNYTNTFLNAQFGVNATNSKATIINNEFESINLDPNNPANCTICGSCIYFENTDNVDRELIIGGPYDNSNSWTDFLKNQFTNSKTGILTRGDHITTIQSNTFNELYQGIRCNRNFENIIINEENSFSETKFGVILFNVRGDIVVDGNVFNDPGIGTGNPSFYRTAISVQNPVSTNRLSNDVSITNNSISDYRIGIHGINSRMTGITGNDIQFNIDDPAKLTNIHSGIWLQQCSGAFVAENTIANSTFMPDLGFRGIDIENSQSCDLNCNSITNIGIGMNFDAHCDHTDLRLNILKDFDIGVNLNNALIDLNQGSYLATDKAWDNKWSMESNNDYTFKVAGQLIGIQTPINWYHQGPDQESNIYSPKLFEGQIIFPDAGETTSIISCTSNTVNSGNRIVEFGPIIGDSASYQEYSEENTYLARTIAFTAMKLDSTIVYQGDSLDSDFEAFLERYDSTNIGKFYTVESLIEREPDSAIAVVQAITPENDIELYLKEYYQRELDIAERGYELLAADSAYFLERTVGIPTTNGEVYYHALGNLFIEQHIPLVSSRIGHQPQLQPSSDVNKSKSELIASPNPTTGQLKLQLSNQSVKISFVEIYNSLGKLVINKTVDNNEYQLDMTPYSQGIYYIRCIDQSKKYYTKSFNLLK
jgi:hypothetical protein